MANWSGFTLTDVGADLQAKINAGLTTLIFTKVGVGSGSGSVNALTAMVHKEQDIGIGNVEANGNIVTINFTLTNKGLGSAYQMRELGLYATDPDKGEVLFAYMTDSTPDTMPADGSATVVSQAVTLNIAFSNTGNVSATIDTGAFVTQEDLEAHEKSITAHSALMAGHNTDTTAHQPILDMISNNQTALNSKIELHNADATAHADIRQMFTWKKLYSTKWSAFVMPANGVALCDIPSTWKELNIAWVWWGSPNFLTYTTNVINESTGDDIVFSIPSDTDTADEGRIIVKGNKLYVKSRGKSNDGAPVLVMWR